MSSMILLFAARIINCSGFMQQMANRINIGKMNLTLIYCAKIQSRFVCSRQFATSLIDNGIPEVQ